MSKIIQQFEQEQLRTDIPALPRATPPYVFKFVLKKVVRASAGFRRHRDCQA